MHDNAFLRLVGALVSPRKTFASIARRPSWLLALLVLVVVNAVSAFVLVPKVDYRDAIVQRFEQQGQPAEGEQVDRAVALASRFASVFVYLATTVLFFGGTLIVALILWGVMRLLGAGNLSFVGTLAGYVHSIVPRGVAALLTIPVIWGRASIPSTEIQSGRGPLVSSLASLVSADASPPLLSLLASVNVFTIWSLVLLVLGLSSVTGLSRGKVAASVVGLWGGWVVLKVGFALLGAMVR